MYEKKSGGRRCHDINMHMDYNKGYMALVNKSKQFVFFCCHLGLIFSIEAPSITQEMEKAPFIDLEAIWIIVNIYISVFVASYGDIK